MSHGGVRPSVSRRSVLCWLALGAAGAPACASRALAPEVAQDLPGARLQGSGRLVFLGLHVYDIRLWVDPGFSAADPAQQPLALEIEYARSLSGARMAERALDEMQRLRPLSAAQRAAWRSAMTRAFPDVERADRLTGIHRPGQGARFFFNGRLQADLPDPDFAEAFFAIWLSPKTSQPGLRQALLGAGA